MDVLGAGPLFHIDQVLDCGSVRQVVLAQKAELLGEPQIPVRGSFTSHTGGDRVQIHQGQPEMFVIVGRGGVGFEVRVLGPRLDDEPGTAGANQVARAVAVRGGREPADVVAVAMGCHNRCEFAALDPLADIPGRRHHDAGLVGGSLRASEVDQNMPLADAIRHIRSSAESNRRSPRDRFAA